MAHASLVATVSRSDRVLVSVLLTIAKRSQKQNVITSPDSDVLSVLCLPIPSLALGRAALVWTD